MPIALVRITLLDQRLSSIHFLVAHDSESHLNRHLELAQSSLGLHLRRHGRAVLPGLRAPPRTLVEPPDAG
jgi:hypothetical protein